MPRALLSLLLLTCALASGCCGVECSPERLPYGGEVYVHEADVHDPEEPFSSSGGDSSGGDSSGVDSSGGGEVGDARPAEDPLDRAHRESFELIQYAARHDCCGVIYAQLSQASQAEHSEFTFCLFWEDLELPAPYHYEVGDLVRDGEYAHWVKGPEEGESFAYVNYDPPPGKLAGPNLLAQLLVVEETDAKGRRVLRLGLFEQLNRLEAGDARYTWDAGR